MNTKLLRQKILDLAIRGKLTEQKKSDGTTRDLLKQIAANVILSNAKNPGKSKNTPKEIIPLDKSEAPFEIPENWEWVRLGDVGVWQAGTTPSKANALYYKGGTIPWLNTGDLTDGLVTDIPKMVTEKALKETSLKMNEAGSVCIAMYGATIGKLGILNIPATTNQACCVCNERVSFVEQKWLFYFLMFNKREFIEAGFGGAQPNISKEKIVSTFFPLPPLAEQQRIVTAIENAFAEITEIENNQELLKKHIKQGRQKILDLAIRGKLTQQLKTDGTTKDLLKQISSNVILSNAKNPAETVKSSRVILSKRSASKDLAKEIIPLDKTTALFEIPESWEWVKLGDIGDWQSGTTPSKSNSAYYENGTIPWLNTGDLNDGLVTNIPKMVTETALKETSLRINAADSVCIAMYGATIGKLGILSVPATTNQACCVCNNLKVGIEKMWLFYFLMNHKQEFIEAGFGGAQPNISKEKIVSTPMPLPPLAEQQRIVATIEQAFAEFNAMEIDLK